MHVERIQPYQVLHKIGEGGMGTVFLGVEPVSERQVALKFLSSSDGASSGFFREEVRLLSRLSHPYLVKIFDYYETAEDRVTGLPEAESAFGSQPFFAMEYVTGFPLHALPRQLDPTGWVRLMTQVLESLAYLHARNILHRDLKPSNILLADDGSPKILDFGLSSQAGGQGGLVRGTLPYMAPEVFWGEPDFVSDLYSVGVLFYECLTGHLPYSPSSTKKNVKPPPSLQSLRSDLPDFFSDLIHRLLELSPSKRPSSALSVLRFIGQHQEAAFSESGNEEAFLAKTPWVERKEFKKFLAAVNFSSPQRVLLKGPTGIGRTRFLEELKWHYQLEGIPFFFVLPPDVGEGFSTSLKKAGFVTKLASSAEEISGLENLLTQGGDSPRVLVFCDLHQWADSHLKELTIFLRMAARVTPHLVCVLELNSDLPTSPILLREEESASKRQINLEELSEVEGRELVRQAAWQDPPSEEEVRSILEASGGRPLLIAEALRQRLRKEDDYRFSTDLSDISKRRVEHLSEGAQKLLAIIVSHSRPVMFHEAEMLWPSSGALLEDCLLELDERGFLAFRSTEHPELRLAQASLRTVFRDTLSKDRILEAHQRWVGFLRAQVQPNVASPEAVLLVEHAWGAEDIANLKAFGLRAAEVEISRGNENAAITWYERMLQHADTPVERYTCHSLRAPLLYRMGHFDAALEAYDLWYQDREDDETQLQKVVHCFFTGLVHFAAGREKEAEARFRAAIQTGDSQRDKPLRFFHGRTLAFLATIEQKRGNFKGAEAHLLRGLSLAQGNSLLLGEMEQRLGELKQDTLQYAEAFTHFERSLAAYQEARSPQAMAAALYYIAMAQRECGRTQEALASMDEAVELSRKSGQILQRARLMENRALIRLDMADYAGAFRDFEESLEVLEVLGTAGDILLLQIQRIELYLRIGNLDRAEKIFKNLSSQSEQIRKEDLGFEVLSKRAEGAYLYGDYARAANLFERSLDLMEGKTRRIHQIIGHLGLCRSFARMGLLSAKKNTLDRTLELLNSVPQLPFRIWETALRLLTIDLKDPTLFQGIQDFIALTESIPWPEMRLDIYGLFAKHFQRGGLHRTALRLKQLSRSEWNGILEKLTEELKMDFEKNRDPDDLDIILSENLPRPTKRVVEAGPVVEVPAETASILILSERRFRQYVEINRQLAERYELKEILERMMDAAIELTGAERGFLLLKEEKAPKGPLEGFVVKTARNLSHHTLNQEEFKFSMSAVRQAVEKGTFLLSQDAQTDSRFHSKKSVVLYQIKSILVTPLETDGQVVGVLYLDHRTRVDCFKEEDLIFLTAFASQAALALQKAKMIQELKNAKQKLEVQVESQAGEILTLSRELVRTREELRYGYEEMVGRSPGMMKVFQLLDHVTETTIPVWVHGESGTGKELVARSLHFNSRRKAAPFVTENVSAIPETLLESELFGHKKGSFTHADRDRIGLFEQASGGTLFLDEVADMSLAMQAKLLRVLQEGEVRPLGSNKKVKVDVRLVTASNKDLERLVREEKFRQDLFFRINGLTIHLPALRERKEDLPLLVDYLTKKITREFNLEAAELSEKALQRLLAHSWPGNIRELEGVLRNALLFAKGHTITPELISIGASLSQGSEPHLPDREEVPTEERRLILEALRKTGMNKRLAAEEMGISLRSLYKRMERHGVPTHKPILAKFLGLKG